MTNVFLAFYGELLLNERCMTPNLGSADGKSNFVVSRKVARTVCHLCDVVYLHHVTFLTCYLGISRACVGGSTLAINPRDLDGGSAKWCR